MNNVNFLGKTWLKNKEKNNDRETEERTHLEKWEMILMVFLFIGKYLSEEKEKGRMERRRQSP